LPTDQFSSLTPTRFSNEWHDLIPFRTRGSEKAERNCLHTLAIRIIAAYADKSRRAKTETFRWRRRSSPVDRKRRAGAIAPRFGRHLAGYRSSTTRPSRRAGCRRRNARSSPRSGGRSPRRLREPQRITHPPPQERGPPRRNRRISRQKSLPRNARMASTWVGTRTRCVFRPQGRRISGAGDAVTIRERVARRRQIGSPIPGLACSLLIRPILEASQLNRKVHSSYPDDDDPGAGRAGLALLHRPRSRDALGCRPFGHERSPWSPIP
jgi:hypothetical protein